MPRRKSNRSSMAAATAGRPRGRRSRLAAASVADLQAELERRQQTASVLSTQRDSLLAELAAIDRELAMYGAPRPRAMKARRTTMRRGRKGSTNGRRRAANKLSLVGVLQQVLKGSTLGVSEAASAVQKAGYKTTSPNFRTIVNAALLSNRNAFKKIARGQYTAR
jgi:hypothetical protein